MKTQTGESRHSSGSIAAEESPFCREGRNLALDLIQSLCGCDVRGSGDLAETVLGVLAHLGAVDGFWIQDRTKHGQNEFLDQSWQCGSGTRLAVAVELGGADAIFARREDLLAVRAGSKLLVYGDHETQWTEVGQPLVCARDRHANEWLMLNLSLCTGCAEAMRWTRMGGFARLTGFPYRWRLVPSLPCAFYGWCCGKASLAEEFAALNKPFASAWRLSPDLWSVPLDSSTLPVFVTLCEEIAKTGSSLRDAAIAILTHYPREARIGPERRVLN